MTSEDRDSFPDGFEIPLPPKVKKRTEKICVVCQAGRPCEPLRKGQECSVEKAIRAAEQRRDKVMLAMFANYNFDTKYIGTRIIMHYIQANKVFGM